MSFAKLTVAKLARNGAHFNFFARTKKKKQRIASKILSHLPKNTIAVNEYSSEEKVILMGPWLITPPVMNDLYHINFTLIKI